MAAYAAVVSLMNTLNNIQNHPLHSFCLDKKQIQSLQKIITFLLDFIESYSSHGGSKEEEAAALESRIASAARAAEDVIESHVADQILAGSSYLLDLEEVVKDMDCVKEKVMQLKETKEFNDRQQYSYSMAVASSKPLTTTKNAMVGFDDELIQIMDRLTGPQPDLQIVPIVGMGGIGKTALASNVFESSYSVEHFDIRAWATISQNYSVVNILSEISKTIGAFDCKMDQEYDEDPKLRHPIYHLTQLNTFYPTNFGITSLLIDLHQFPDPFHNRMLLSFN